MSKFRRNKALRSADHEITFHLLKGVASNLNSSQSWWVFNFLNYFSAFSLECSNFLVQQLALLLDLCNLHSNSLSQIVTKSWKLRVEEFVYRSNWIIGYSLCFVSHTRSAAASAGDSRSTRIDLATFNWFDYSGGAEGKPDSPQLRGGGKQPLPFTLFGQAFSDFRVAVEVEMFKIDAQLKRLQKKLEDDKIRLAQVSSLPCRD